MPTLRRNAVGGQSGWSLDRRNQGAGRGSRLCRLEGGPPAVYLKTCQPCPRSLLGAAVIADWAKIHWAIGVKGDLTDGLACFRTPVCRSRLLSHILKLVVKRSSSQMELPEFRWIKTP